MIKWDLARIIIFVVLLLTAGYTLEFSDHAREWWRENQKLRRRKNVR